MIPLCSSNSDAAIMDVRAEALELSAQWRESEMGCQERWVPASFKSTIMIQDVGRAEQPFIYSTSIQSTTK